MQSIATQLLRKVSLLLLFICCAFSLSATHNRAGEITYEQIGPNTIRMKITTYTKTSGQSAQADRSELDVNWGDGTTQTVPRDNFVQIYPDIRRNEYIAIHTYPGANLPGQPYVVSMQDPNRNENILNINNGNSVNVEFYIQTEVFLFASSAAGANSSPILLEPPVDFGVVGQIFQHTPNGFDPDGDSIAYELITPASDRGTAVPGYVPVSFIAAGPNNNFSFDTHTGLFTWNSPQQAGEYNIAILVKSYRNGQYLGGIVRDIQIEIHNAQNTPPVIEVPSEICVQAGENVNFTVTATDNDLPSQIVTLTATGGPLIANTSPATFAAAQGNPVSSVFNWNTSCFHIQAQPHQVVFKARDTYVINGGNTDASLATFAVVQIRVVAPPPQNVQAQVSGGRVVLTWDAPYVCDNAPGFFGFTVWRKDICDPFEPDSCEVGLAGRGYTRINPTLVRTPTGNQYQYIDTDVTQGALYSYRILGEFATPVYNNGNIVNYQSPVSSMPSAELCVRMARDLPLMTNVDINTTLTSNAEIFVQWSKPDADELDTTQNLPPYRYELFRSQDQSGANFLSTPIFVSPTYTTFAAANDTSFTDIAANINTEDFPYAYRVAFYANGDTLGFTSIASSVRLNVAATDGRNDLSWTFNVPWRNYQYVVYLETPTGSGTFTVLDTVETPEYAHIGLTNGETYCYYVKSIGSYGIPSVLDPLYNKSQRACGTPLDTLPPCPIAAISAVVGCDNIDDNSSMNQLFNTISWQRADANCAADAAFYRVYFSPYCNGTYTLVAQSNSINDTFLLHQPDTNNLAGCYYVTVVDSIDANGGGNESAASGVVRTENCPIYSLPNTFTPNGDGQNETFRPYLPYRYIKSVDFVVINRWGQTVFTTTDPMIGWDGTDQNNGKPLAEGTYFYTCIANLNTLDPVEPIKLSGYVELLRGGQ